MGVGGVAAYLGLKKKAVYRLVETRMIPHSRIGRKVMFDRTDIERWLIECRIAPVPPDTSAERVDPVALDRSNETSNRPPKTTTRS
jgi:excisionase family DNA binding protein